MPRGFGDAVTMSMQKEALRRVREMQRQAQQNIEYSEPAPRPPQNQPNNQQHQNEPPFQSGNSPQDILSQILGGKTGGFGQLGDTLQSTIASASQPAAELLKNFGIDGEKLIIMMIMWAVFNEHKDNKLLLMALGYLLL